MAKLRLILGDQLSFDLASLRDADKVRDVILMAEVMSEATYVRHHKQKIAFFFSAMRHFAAALTRAGYRVRYTEIDDPAAAPDLKGEVVRALATDAALDGVVLTQCGEYRLDLEMRGWAEDLGIPVDIREDDRFVCGRAEFATWAKGRKGLTMEFFYREMRKKTGLLMNGAAPEGGQWNFDADNRKKLPKGYKPPPRYRSVPDEITTAVLKRVEDRFPEHFGSLDHFGFAVTRAEALTALDNFIDDCLPDFGQYQDAMAMGEDFLNHSLLSAYINIGLLQPLEVCERAVAAYRKGSAPLNAVEGFVRQIIGWREFVRGVYWLKMPAYKDVNALTATRPLPPLYWTGETKMTCLSEAVRATQKTAYAHHIQRLMVTGNFALLAGIAPEAINEWYLIVYADALEWVQLPNTHGMAIWADGGIIGTKPYAASGAYIHRMSDYCGKCAYKVSEKTGKDACPFNYLYWDFMMRHEDRLRLNNRMSMVYKNLDRKSEAERQAIRHSAQTFLDEIAPEG